MPIANPELAIQLSSGLELTPGHKITLGVRPEHLTLRPDADERGLEGKVVFCENSGQESAVALDLGGLQLVASLWGDDPPSIGDRTGLEIQTANMLLFDETGQRIEPKATN